jgi:hypothetical protein
VRAFVAALSLVVASCGGPSPAAPSASASGASPVAAPFASAHFVFFYTTLDSQNIEVIARAAEAEYSRILHDLGVDTLPPVQVHFYADHQALEAAVAAVAGPIPSWASGLATAQDQIHLMSPNHPAYAPFNRMLSNIVHEFAHCVSMRANPRIPNNPRWLWESVAIYESGQLVDPKTLAYMAAARPPAFATLNSLDNTLIYDVGYTIAAFIVGKGGQAALDELVRNNGDVATTFGIALDAFEREWYGFVRARYGI